ncbi:hypothetical protein [Streptomyces sp. WAC06273]|uniref:hypothetical protein n=1 Tax=Streptomyces sp. WAC06273 TaxID=2487422 RepID=UPI00159DAAFD|nr:hypothetical protein [Streptomyces sp. WAC06273]
MAPAEVGFRDEPGWQIVYLTIGGWQCSWHISPRGADLFQHVERVGALDVRAVWDGHTTEKKYQHIAAWTAELAQHGGPAPLRTGHPAYEAEAGP